MIKAVRRIVVSRVKRKERLGEVGDEEGKRKECELSEAWPLFLFLFLTVIVALVVGMHYSLNTGKC
jgi:hypothetical protein